MPINIPIVRLKQVVESLFKWVKNDYNANIENNTEQESYLYKTLNGYSDVNYDFYQQAKDIFVRTDENARKLSVKLMFPKAIQSVPSVYVREPAKQKGGSNSLGMGIGGNSYDSESSLTNGILRQTFNANYEIVIVSDNPLETVLISEVLLSLLIGSHQSLNDWFNRYSFSVKELILNHEHEANQFYVRSVIMEGEYETNIHSTSKSNIPIAINFSSKIVL